MSTVGSAPKVPQAATPSPQASPTNDGSFIQNNVPDLATPVVALQQRASTASAPTQAPGAPTSPTPPSTQPNPTPPTSTKPPEVKPNPQKLPVTVTTSARYLEGTQTRGVAVEQRVSVGPIPLGRDRQGKTNLTGTVDVYGRLNEGQNKLNGNDLSNTVVGIQPRVNLKLNDRTSVQGTAYLEFQNGLNGTKPVSNTEKGAEVAVPWKIYTSGDKDNTTVSVRPYAGVVSATNNVTEVTSNRGQVGLNATLNQKLGPNASLSVGPFVQHRLPFDDNSAKTTIVGATLGPRISFTESTGKTETGFVEVLASFVPKGFGLPSVSNFMNGNAEGFGIRFNAGLKF